MDRSRAGQLAPHEYAGDWLQHRSTIRRRTYELYDSLLRNHILPHLGDTALAAMTLRLVCHGTPAFSLARAWAP